MDAFLYWRYRQGGGESPFADWELSKGLTWQEAPAPAEVGRRVVEGLFTVKLPDESAPLVNNLVHWGYGMAWGSMFGVLEGSLHRRRFLHGMLFAPVVFLSGYVVLPLAKLYKPIWEYDLPTLGKDFAGHLAYGLGTGTAFRVLVGSGRSARG